MKKKLSVRYITLSAMLVAMSVVIGIFCKSVLNFGGGLFRVTFENLPIILSGILFGPLAGATVGLLSDVLSYLLSGQSYPLNVIVTLGATSVGLVSGLVSRFWVKKRGIKQIILAASAAHIVGSMIIKPIGLYTFYGWAVLFRIPLYLAIAPIEILLLCLLYKKSGFRRLIDGFDKEDI
ncbi:MAG: folate family ECF transporter S component [Clostridia bacterium]|nr:folate family ECF transporter S component [Clostridia bacterium]